MCNATWPFHCCCVLHSTVSLSLSAPHAWVCVERVYNPCVSRGYLVSACTLCVCVCAVDTICVWVCALDTHRCLSVCALHPHAGMYPFVRSTHISVLQHHTNGTHSTVSSGHAACTHSLTLAPICIFKKAGDFLYRWLRWVDSGQEMTWDVMELQVDIRRWHDIFSCDESTWCLLSCSLLMLSSHDVFSLALFSFEKRSCQMTWRDMTCTLSLYMPVLVQIAAWIPLWHHSLWHHSHTTQHSRLFDMPHWRVTQLIDTRHIHTWRSPLKWHTQHTQQCWHIIRRIHISHTSFMTHLIDDWHDALKCDINIIYAHLRTRARTRAHTRAHTPRTHIHWYI